MARISKSIVCWAGAVFCVAFLACISFAPMAEARSGEQSKQDAAEQVSEPYADSQILVEAFVAEVKLETLYKSGVSPVGQKPNSVSIENILQCLKVKGGGGVTSGAKVALRQKKESSTGVQETKYMEREQQVTGRDGTVTTKKRFDDYSMGLTFNARAVVKPDEKIVVTFSFSQSGFVFSKKDKPADRVNRNWAGTICLDAGKPSIVGATQDEKTSVFLILVADVESE